MVDQRLVNYIRDNLQRGYPPDSLRQTLLKQGWGMREVDEAFAAVQSPAPAISQTSPGKPSRPTGVTIICVLGLLGAAFMLILGVAVIGFTGIITEGISESNITISPEETSFIASFTTLVGWFSAGLAIVSFMGFYLLLKMKKAGLIIITIIGAANIIMGVISFVSFRTFNFSGIWSMVIWAVVIGYLWMKRKLFV